MGARMRVFLSRAEEQTLWELRTATTVPQRVKDRAEAIRLSHQGWYVEKIAAHLHWQVETVRKTIKRWQQGGLGGLWDAPGRGKTASWKEEDIAYLEDCLREEERTYNSVQLAEKLKRERGVRLSPEHLRQVLKKRG
jgi:transposase